MGHWEYVGLTYMYGNTYTHTHIHVKKTIVGFDLCII